MKLDSSGSISLVIVTGFVVSLTFWGVAVKASAVALTPVLPIHAYLPKSAVDDQLLKAENALKEKNSQEALTQLKEAQNKVSSSGAKISALGDSKISLVKSDIQKAIIALQKGDSRTALEQVQDANNLLSNDKRGNMTSTSLNGTTTQ